MKAMIMAGGKGTRLRPLTCELPKPMIPVMNIPIMEHIILLLKDAGITEIGVTLMYLPQKIQNYFGDGTPWDVHLTYFMEDNPLGTAGSILQAASFLDETFVVFSGDCITNMDLSRIIAFHHLKKAMATLVLTHVDNPHRFGIVATDNSSYITNFLEKPSRNEIFSDTINTGIYVMEPNVLSHIKPEMPYDFSHDLFPALLEKGFPLSGYTSFDYWSDIGSLEAYLNTHMEIFDQHWITFSRGKQDPISIGKATVIEPSAVINGPCVIGNNCYIGHGTVIDSYTVIGDNCLIEDQTSIKRSILLNNCVIGSGCELRGSILGAKVRLMRNVSSYEYAAVGDESIIHERSIIKPNIHIWPGKTVEALSIVDRNIVWATHFTPSLFNAGNLTGTINVDITPEFTSRLGSAYGSVLGQKNELVVSSDGSSPANMFKYAFISGLMSVGIKVCHLDGMNIPMARQTIQRMKVSGGVHIGKKADSIEKLEVTFFDKTGANIDNTLEKDIERVFYKEDFMRCRPPSIIDIRHIADGQQYYVSNLKRCIHFSCIKKEPPAVFIVSNCEKTLSFVNTVFEQLHIPVCGDMLVDVFEPKKIRNVKHFICADMTAFIDSNGEKLILLDPVGKILDDTRLFLLQAYILLKTIPGCEVVAPLNMTTALERLAGKYNGSVKRTNASQQAILCELMKKDVYADSLNQYLLQFDALASLVKMIEFLCTHHTSLDNVLKFIPGFFLEHTLILCPFEATGKVMRILGTENSSHRQIFNGIRIAGNSGWILILPDAEKPFLHLYTEGHSRKEAVMLLNKYSSRIKKLVDDNTVSLT